MLINYLKTTIRAIRKSPIYGLLNIAGLALGIACAAMIFLWVEDELAFDYTVAKRNVLYSIRMNIDYSGRIESFTAVPGPMSEAIRGTIPGVVNNSRVGMGRELFGLNDKTTYEFGFYVDTSYFSMMQPSFIRGSAAGFNNPHSLVITETMANKFFGKADPVGKTLRVGNQENYMVIGVVKDAPQNVSLQFGWLAPVSNFFEKNTWLNYWGTWGVTTLVELKPGANVNAVNKQLIALLRPKNKIYTNADCFLWSMNDWHLYDNYTNGKPDGGGIRFVRLFVTIACIILFLACINFMNLSTARAGQRVKEIGVRKTLGALKKGLIGQFILESLLMSFIAMLLAILLIYLILPGFNVLFDKQLRFDVFMPTHIYGLLGLGVFCGLIAGVYPAFYLSSFHPVAVLKGQRIGLKTGAGFIRKGLVVVQFTVSVALIICTVIIYQQVQHIKDRDLGYNKQNLLFMDVRSNIDVVEHFDAVRSELLQTGVVENTALSDSPPLEMWSTLPSSRFTWEGSDPENEIKVHWEGASPEYISTMGLQLKEGRNFHSDIQSDSGNVIINESMAKLMGKAGRVGGVLTYSGKYVYHVIGIVKNYLFNNMYESVAPLMLSCNPETKGNYGFLSIRLKPGDHLSSRLAKVEAVLKTSNPGYPFEYQFVDERFDRLFHTETRLGELAGVFAALAILISCLGLFGLAAYTADRRTKELGIRKVLGASVTNLTTLLSKEFLQLVTISCLVAFPVAWWIMSNWLTSYPYRTVIHWWVFGLAGITALLIAMLTVSSQAIRAALSNPVETLRSE